MRIVVKSIALLCSPFLEERWPRIHIYSVTIRPGGHGLSRNKIKMLVIKKSVREACGRVSECTENKGIFMSH